MNVPVFCLELEWQIFEICAWSRPESIRRLILVAWRVKVWVEPHLYHTIAVTHSCPMQGYPIFTTNRLLLPFFRDNVRNLLLHEVPEYALKTIVSVCTRVENLCISNIATNTRFFDPPFIHKFVAPLTLKRVYADMNPLLLNLSPGHPSFALLTHIEISRPIDTGAWDRLFLIGPLTHLSFTSVDFIPISLRILEKRKSLRVLVSLSVGSLKHGLHSEYGTALARDPRFVAMRRAYFLKDWQRGVHNEQDYWSRAEDFIAKRRRGEVDGVFSFISQWPLKELISPGIQHCSMNVLRTKAN
ncbi:hypothetical protein B0H13DRAFT_2437604 [Mycena leptocephala]|nr:hypothetical protein B0H13DRAFT_2437604 [Mycena leptocephala]